MRLLVLGGSGMLGRRVVEQARAAGHEVSAPPHRSCDVRSAEAVFSTLLEARPDVVLNCAGCLPGAEPVEMLQTNAIGPHIVAAAAAAAGARVVHMSTDCVYSGQMLGYEVSDRQPIGSGVIADPDGLYGRSKLAGEVSAPHVLNVRGSFIGPEGGFLRWLLDARGPIDAWTEAWWNGTTVEMMAGALVALAPRHDTYGVGVIHAASPWPLSKADMVLLFVKALKLPVTVSWVEQPRLWRVLAPDLELPGAYDELTKYATALAEAVPS